MHISTKKVFHLLFLVTIEGLMISKGMWRAKIGDFDIKPVKIGGFSIFAHEYSCLLISVHLLFFVTIDGLMIWNKHVEGQNRGS